MKQKKPDLLHGPIRSELLWFSIPMLLSNIFQSFYNMMDIAIVGNELGELSLSAIGSCTALYSFILMFSTGFRNGLSIVVGRYYGAEDEDAIRSCTALSLLIGVVLSLVIWLFSSSGLTVVLRMLNTPENVLGEAHSYLSIIVGFAGIMFFYNLLSADLRAIGNSTAPLYFLIFSSLLNIVLDLFAIRILKLGVAEAAWATVLAQLIASLFCLFYIRTHAQILIPKRSSFHIRMDLLKDLLSQGSSMALMMAIVSAGSVVLQSGINALGNEVIAGHTTALTVSGFMMMPLLAFSSSCSVVVSQNYGSRQYKRVIESLRASNLLCWGWSMISILFSFTAGRQVLHLISGSNSSVILNNGAAYLRTAACFYPILSVLFNIRNSLQGIGKKLVPLFSSMIELVLKIVFTLWVIPTFHYQAVIYCEPLIWCVMTVQLLATFQKQKKLLLNS
ncbi:MAG: MATE family efflux transporter [Solobacterium sp.]|nr:MATE family efflux transporter [Solobacterium sp.]